MNTRQIMGGNFTRKKKSPRTENDYLATELWNGKSVRKGDWKIVNVPTPIGTGGWQLYNVKNDPGERNDLAKEQPEKLKELLTNWEEYMDKIMSYFQPELLMMEWKISFLRDLRFMHLISVREVKELKKNKFRSCASINLIKK